MAAERGLRRHLADARMPRWYSHRLHLGINVPKDVCLVGFENVCFASLLTIPLTTMEQPCRDIAITAFNALRERIKNPTLSPRTLMLTPQITVRETCGAYLDQPYQ
jgi:DNA-binding LacI/PurR family transcriptional regulator